jgi:DNA-binding MarR family transcriptional regulator
VTDAREVVPDDAAVMTAVRAIILAGERLRQNLSADRGVGLSELVALGHLYHDGELTPRELSDRLGLSSGTMTALVDRLEAAGLASRLPNPDDRRSQLIRISDHANELMASLYAQFVAAAAGTLSTVSAGTRRELIRVLTAMSAEIDQFSKGFVSDSDETDAETG